MPILTPVPKRKRNARTADGIQAMIIEDACVFNLQALMLGLGLSEESTKRWVSRHGIRAATQGRTWVFTGEEVPTGPRRAFPEETRRSARPAIEMAKTTSKPVVMPQSFGDEGLGIFDDQRVYTQHAVARILWSEAHERGVQQVRAPQTAPRGASVRQSRPAVPGQRAGCSTSGCMSVRRPGMSTLRYGRDD